MRRDVELEKRLNDRSGNRIVTAAGAERRDRALVIAPRKSQRILRQIGVVDFRFGEVSHVYSTL